MFGPGLFISVKVIPSNERYTLKAISLLELSVHVNLIWVEEIAVADRLLGAFGFTVAAAKVVATAVFESAVLPEALNASTR